VWRLDWLPFLRSPRFFLRLGAAQFQLWMRMDSRLELMASHDSQHIAHNRYAAVTDLLMHMRQDLPAGARVHVLGDSKWMPLSLLLTGRQPLASAQVRALARHRFSDVFGESAQAWDVQVDYVGGDTRALAFANPIGLMAAVRQGLGIDAPGDFNKLRLVGMQPTCSWAWHQGDVRKSGSANSWLVFAEHDRSIMARLSKGRIAALQASGPIVSNPGALSAVLRTEALRCGVVDEEHDALSVSFEPNLFPSCHGVRWRALGTTEVQT
jgi:hypothetical protein